MVSLNDFAVFYVSPFSHWIDASTRVKTASLAIVEPGSAFRWNQGKRIRTVWWPGGPLSIDKPQSHRKRPLPVDNPDEHPQGPGLPHTVIGAKLVRCDVDVFVRRPC